MSFGLNSSVCMGKVMMVCMVIASTMLKRCLNNRIWGGKKPKPNQAFQHHSEDLHSSVDLGLQCSLQGQVSAGPLKQLWADTLIRLQI